MLSGRRFLAGFMDYQWMLLFPVPCRCFGLGYFHPVLQLQESLEKNELDILGTFQKMANGSDSGFVLNRCSCMGAFIYLTLSKMFKKPVLYRFFYALTF